MLDFVEYLFSINPSRPTHNKYNAKCKCVRVIMPRSRRGDTAETNNFSVWPNDDIRTVTMSTENYGLAVACLFSSLLWHYNIHPI